MSLLLKMMVRHFKRKINSFLLVRRGEEILNKNLFSISIFIFLEENLYFYL